jgi:RNA polymerase-binding transcription factor DksA
MGLNPEERQRIELRLHDERERVLKVLRRFEEGRENSAAEAAGDISEYPFHVADRELEEIDEALRRFYEEPDRFGICENTGEPIPMERLDIVPWTRTCITQDAGLP